MRKSLLSAAAFAIALSVLGAAPVAQARPLFTISIPLRLEGARTGSDRFIIGGTEIACGGVAYRGLFYNVGDDGTSPTLEVLPEPYDCMAKVLTGLPADFLQETCAYRLHDLQPTGQAEHWKAAVDVRCNPGYDSNGWNLFETEERFSQAHQLCQTRVLERPEAGTALVSNLRGPRRGIEVHWDFHNLDYQVYTSAGFGSSLVCGSPPGGTATGASYTGAARIFPADTPQHRLVLQVTK